MKFNLFTAVLATALVASTAVAGGDHAGSHHGDSGVIGQPGKAATVTRTVAVDMTDAMRFIPARIAVKQGETIRFVVKNSGKVKHEMVLGTEKELKEHYEAMKKNPEMEHADENMVTVQSGKSGEIIWHFTKAGKVNFACLQPGHYGAGMKGAVAVSGKAAASSIPAHAQEKPAAAQATAPSADMTDGEIRKIDKDNKKITIKHGEIKSLDMPAMSMVFQVKDPVMFEKLKVGDKVKFVAEKSGGAIVVTHIQQGK